MQYVHQYPTGCSTFPFLSVVSILFIPYLTAARLVNITVDDQNPDPLTGNIFTYSPSDTWNIGNGCQVCLAKLDASQTLDATWHDASYYASKVGSQIRTASLEFNGSAIYVYGIISQSLDYASASYLFFFIDGQPAGSYVHTPLGSNTFDYNVSFWSSGSLAPGPHRFELQNGQANGNDSLILFDYVVYTTDDGTSEPSTPKISGEGQALTTANSNIAQSSTTRSSTVQSSVTLQSTPPSLPSATRMSRTQPTGTNSLSLSVTFSIHSTTSASSSASPVSHTIEEARKEIAASVAAVLLFVVLAIMFYIRCRRSRRSQEGAVRSSESLPIGSVTPFYLDAPQCNGQERHDTLSYPPEDYPADKILNQISLDVIADPNPLHSDEFRVIHASAPQDLLSEPSQIQNMEAPPSYITAI